MAAILPTASMIFWSIITFSLLVVLHEGGHFLVARLFGVKVHEFMIGLPGPALRLRTKGTTYGITMIPLGGYVKIAGMEPGAEDPMLARALMTAATQGRIDADELAGRLGVSTEDAARLLTTLADWGAIRAAEDDDVSYIAQIEPRDGESEDDLLDRARSVTYRGRKTWQRISILAAGVLVNLMAAILTFTVVFAMFGYITASLTVDSIAPNSAAQEAGLRPGDRIVAIGDTRLDAWEELLLAIDRYEPGDRVEIEYQRDGVERSTQAVLGETGGEPRLGVVAKIERRNFNLGTAFVESLRWTGMVFRAIGDFFRPSTFARSLEGARSVIGITEEVAAAVKAGPIEYAWLVALLSLSLGVMNLLPIPPLDGGKVVMEIVERILGRPIKREVYLAISASGALLLFTLIAYLMYADVVRLVTNG